jgi:hypothetical protein
MRQGIEHPIKTSTSGGHRSAPPQPNHCGDQVVMSYRLPSLASEGLSDRLDEATRGAYSSVLLHERWAESQRSIPRRKLVCARVLGRLLLEAPSTRARHSVVEEVNACQDDNGRLYQLGEMFFEHYIRLCKSLTGTTFFSHTDNLLTVKRHKGPPPAPFRHSWRVPFETEKARMKESVYETGDPSAHYEQAKISVSVNFLINSPFYSSAFSKVHRRDNYQCLFIGYYDSKSCDEFPNVRQEMESSLTPMTTNVECAHIFPRSTNAISQVSNTDAKVWFDIFHSFLLLLTTLCSVSMPHQYGQ